MLYAENTNSVSSTPVSRDPGFLVLHKLSAFYEK